MGTAALAITELLSLFHLLSPWPLAIAWALAAALWFRRTARFPKLRRVPLEWLLAAAVAVPVLLAALLSPPNSADAMAYHLPRVVYWAQARSVAFFPTPYLNQIMLQPLAEYFMLHSYLLTGGDRFINCIAFCAYLGSILGVSAIARALGLGPRAQAWAAVLCATLPTAILQGSGAKNDFVLTFYLVCAVYFAARRDARYFALAAALALATKGTAYLFLPPVMVCAATMLPRRQWVWIPIAVLALNGSQYVRNVQLSGSPLGFDSAQADGVYRWRNEPPGWRAMISNAVRHTAEQLGGRSPAWNRAVFDTAQRLHHSLGLDPNDPGTTWPGTRFAPPVNSNHEANANNHWHLLLIVLAAAAALLLRDRRWMSYSTALAAAFLCFCLYLKWQPFLARLELPLFVLATPLVAWALDRSRMPLLAVLVCLFLVNSARPALFENWTRPLKGPHSLFVTKRDDNYFSDMGQWHSQASYLEAVARTAQAGCLLVGIDINRNQLEYPYQALLRERLPGVRFVHTGVVNASARYQPSAAPKPCAVFCPDCAAIPQKSALYGDAIQLDRSLLFLFPR
jgi:hypothetical protein